MSNKSRNDSPPAPPEGGDSATPGRQPYRIRPRKVGFGFDIARAKELATEIEDEHILQKLREGR